MNPNPYDSPQSSPPGLQVWERDPVLVLVLTFVTCGIYLFFWYYQVYEEMDRLHSLSPTGNPYFLDLLLVILTCGIWGIYVDYAISDKLNQIQARYNMPPNDTTTTAVLLDIVAYFVGLTNIVTSMIQQDQLNKIRAAMGQAAGSSGASSNAPVSAEPPSSSAASGTSDLTRNYTDGQSPRADDLDNLGRSSDSKGNFGDFGDFGKKDDGNPYS